MADCLIHQCGANKAIEKEVELLWAKYLIKLKAVKEKKKTAVQSQKDSIIPKWYRPIIMEQPRQDESDASFSEDPPYNPRKV